MLGKSCQYSENDHLEILNTYLDGKSFQFTALEHAFVMQAQMMDVSVVGHAWLIPAHSICLPHALPFEMSHVYVMKFAFLVPAVMGQCICNIDTNYPCADDEVSIYKTTLIQATLPTHQSVKKCVVPNAVDSCHMNTPMICSDGCEYPNEYSTSKADFNA